MSPEQKREAVKKAYGNGPIWVSKVEKMSDAQIHTIYTRLLNANQL